MKILFSHFSWLQEELSYSDYLLGEAMLTWKFVLRVEGQLCCYSPYVRVVLWGRPCSQVLRTYCSNGNGRILLKRSYYLIVLLFTNSNIFLILVLFLQSECRESRNMSVSWSGWHRVWSDMGVAFWDCLSGRQFSVHKQFSLLNTPWSQ